MTSLATCVVCNQGMLQVEPDQITHPCCDPDDTPLPVLSVDEITELFNSSEWLRLSERPGRCTSCGSHPATQGHLAKCESKEAQQHLFATRPLAVTVANRTTNAASPNAASHDTRRLDDHRRVLNPRAPSKFFVIMRRSRIASRAEPRSFLSGFRGADSSRQTFMAKNLRVGPVLNQD